MIFSDPIQWGGVPYADAYLYNLCVVRKQAVKIGRSSLHKSCKKCGDGGKIALLCFLLPATTNDRVQLCRACSSCCSTAGCELRFNGTDSYGMESVE